MRFCAYDTFSIISDYAGRGNSPKERPPRRRRPQAREKAGCPAFPFQQNFTKIPVLFDYFSRASCLASPGCSITCGCFIRLYAWIMSAHSMRFFWISQLMWNGLWMSPA